MPQQQSRAEIRLQAANVVADRALRNQQLLASAAEAEMAPDRFEGS